MQLSRGFKMQKTNLLIIAVFISLIALFILKAPSNGHTFSLKDSYDFYKIYYMTKDGRITDPQRGNISTSEGQSYMMLKSMIVNDFKTFDLVFGWSQNNLQRRDKLFSWLWGENKTGEYTVLDKNSASDADIDIAFSLISAYEKTKNKKYLKSAIPIINSIWEKETRMIGGIRVLMPGAEQTQSEKIEVNPSYFSPYAFRVFQKYDTKHDWNKLIDSSYHYLAKSMAQTKTGLPPDWFLIHNNQIVLERSSRSDFSYDAIRVFARIFLDYKKTGDKRALKILKSADFFTENQKKTGKIYVNYSSEGQVQNNDEFTGSIAILIPVINMSDEKTAKEIYNEKLLPLFKDKGYWSSTKDYYGQNLLWFGCYLYKCDKTYVSLNE